MNTKARGFFAIVGLLVFLSSVVIWYFVEPIVQLPEPLNNSIVFSGLWAIMGLGIMVLSVIGEGKDTSKPAE